MQQRQTTRRDMAKNSGGYQSRRDLMVDQSQNPPVDETDDNPESEQGNRQERQLEHCQSYSVLAPNEKKRRELLQQRERNLQFYEKAKAENRMKYDNERPQKIGGPRVSKDELLEKRIREQRKAEALEKRKAYEQKKKREKWAEEKKIAEEKEINEKKQRARAQAERNEEKRRQDERERKQKFDDERRRRWQNIRSDESKREQNQVYSIDAGIESNPSADELREFYARRYDRAQHLSTNNGRQCSNDGRGDARCRAQQYSHGRCNDELHTPSYEECKDSFSRLSTEEDSCFSESAEKDMKDLCKMFPLVARELINDIYIQTGHSLADTWAVLSSK